MFLDADASLRVSSDMLGNQVETVVDYSPVMEVDKGQRVGGLNSSKLNCDLDLLVF